MKLNIIEDGKVNGWFVAMCITIFNFGSILLALLGVKAFVTGWREIGHHIITLSLGLVGIWFVSKRVQDLAPLLEKFLDKIKKGGEQ